MIKYVPLTFLFFCLSSCGVTGTGHRQSTQTIENTPEAVTIKSESEAISNRVTPEAIPTGVTPEAIPTGVPFEAKASGASPEFSMVRAETELANYASELTDSDKDGVLDSIDFCPSSPLSDSVDSKGCSLGQTYVQYKCIPNKQGGCLADLPVLSWPLPQPNKTKTFRVNELTGIDMSFIGTISNDLESILMKNGYERFSYYHVPLGIAMVTQLERITSDGSPHPERWKFGDLTLSTKNFDFIRFLKRFVGVDSGLYRVLVFIVSHNSVNIKFEPTEGSTQFIKGLPFNGATGLPQDLALFTFEDGMKVTLIIYELELRQTKTEAEFIRTGLQIKDHLLKTGIFLRSSN